MKINMNDLSQEIIDLIKKEDKDNIKNLKEGVMVKTHSGVITYPIDALNLRTIKSSADMDKYEELLYRETPTYKNSFQTEMIQPIKLNQAFPSALSSIEMEDLFNGGGIWDVKSFNNFLLIENINGVISILNTKNSKVVGSVKLLEILRNKFSLNVKTDDILDFTMFEEGLLVSTKNNGVYYINLRNDKVELVISQNNIIHIEVLPDGKLMLVRLDGDIYIYETTEFLRVEKLYMLKNYGQTIQSIHSENGKTFILGKNRFSSDSENLLHLLSYNDGGFSYVNASDNIYQGLGHRDYNIINMSVTDEHLILSGTYKNHPLIWVYDKSNTSKRPKEVIRYDIEIAKLTSSTAFGNEVFFFDGDKLLSLNLSGGIERNYLLPAEVNEVIVSNKIYLVSEKSVSVLELKEAGYYRDITLKIDTKNTNNVELFIKVDSSLKEISILNESAEVIHPYIHLRTDKGIYLQVLGNESDELFLKMQTDGKSKIEGVVVGKNHLFLK